MTKTKKPNEKKWKIYLEKWIETGGMIPPKEAARLLNVSEGHISRHALDMGLEKEGKYITFKSLVKVINTRCSNEEESETSGDCVPSGDPTPKREKLPI